MPLLELQQLSTVFDTERGVLRAVDEVSFSVNQGETLAIVGESGCGKTVTALSIMRLIGHPGRIESGKIFLDQKNILGLTEQKMRNIRGGEISMIFQDPMTSLNPVLTIGDQISEAICLHQGVNSKAALDIADEMLQKVGMPDSRQKLREYPHQLSGGMRQRAMIAMALSCSPKLIIADEPTTALDVTVQSQVLGLFQLLKQLGDVSILIITHNLGVVAEIADRAIVMYAGQIVEQGNVVPLFHNPLHPYTQGLLRSIPSIRPSSYKKQLISIPGNVPNMARLPVGCRFKDRCDQRFTQCDLPPPFIDKADNQKVRCWRYQ
ncbi:MAG: ABC transporter ATP-binding protein [Pseudomonadota bacterium]